MRIIKLWLKWKHFNIALPTWILTKLKQLYMRILWDWLLSKSVWIHPMLTMPKQTSQLLVFES
jgi:hypothetical protein